MSDINQVPPTPAPVSKEVEEGKTFAILSYALGLVLIPFFLIPLITRKNDFSLYHAKQCLLLALAAIGVWVAGLNTALLFCLGFFIWVGGALLLVVLDIMGLAAAMKGEQKPIPLIGKYAEEWFRGLKKI